MIGCFGNCAEDRWKESLTLDDEDCVDTIDFNGDTYEIKSEDFDKVMHELCRVLEYYGARKT